MSTRLDKALSKMINPPLALKRKCCSAMLLPYMKIRGPVNVKKAEIPESNVSVKMAEILESIDNVKKAKISELINVKKAEISELINVKKAEIPEPNDSVKTQILELIDNLEKAEIPELTTNVKKAQISELITVKKAENFIVQLLKSDEEFFTTVLLGWDSIEAYDPFDLISKRWQKACDIVQAFGKKFDQEIINRKTQLLYDVLTHIITAIYEGVETWPEFCMTTGILLWIAFEVCAHNSQALFKDADPQQICRLIKRQLPGRIHAQAVRMMIKKEQENPNLGKYSPNWIQLVGKLYTDYREWKAGSPSQASQWPSRMQGID